MSVKMEDVARAAGVSTATVSRVLNNPDLVSDDTKQRVMDAIQQLDYKINLAARSLRTNQTRTIAIVIPTISEPVMNELVEAVEDVAVQENYTLLLCSTRGNPEREQAYIRLLTQQTIADGVLYLSPRAAPDVVRQLLDGPAPVILCNYSLDDTATPSVMMDHVSSIQQTTAYLLSLGHRQVALLNLSAPHYYPARMRHQGFENAFAEIGLTPDPILIKELDQPTYEHDEWQDTIHQLFDLPDPPTAIVAFNDMVALQVYAVCRQRGLRIPDDISVTGCDDILSASHVEPALTTVRIPAREQGRIAMQYLLKMITQPEASINSLTLIPVELVTRESCTVPAG
ncbi:MAG: LacI family DNA-binding transcriptional regulator [Anaerolineae bacterium]|nr:LacI family DNA-binding transcriptional regulator [Anaerolineae bacterium]